MPRLPSPGRSATEMPSYRNVSGRAAGITRASLVPTGTVGTRGDARRSYDLPDRLDRLDADQLLIQAAEEIIQPVRIQAQLVQDGGVQVLDVEGTLHGGRANV